MRRIVLDTNCLIQIISPRAQFRFVWDAFLNGKYRLCVSTEILDEYHEILSLFMGPYVADNILAVITNSAHVDFLDPRFRFFIVKSDVDDNKFVDCAIVGQAEFIVTEDRHFKEVEECAFPKINVIRLDEFAEIVKKI